MAIITFPKIKGNYHLFPFSRYLQFNNQEETSTFHGLGQSRLTYIANFFYKKVVITV